MPISSRQRDLLATLASCGDDWVRPMDIGARDASHHSMTLRSLVKRGFVERRLRGSLLNQIRGEALYAQLSAAKRRSRHAPRGSYVYRITDAGRAALA